MSDTTDNTDEPTKAELHDRVKQLESTVEKLIPSRRDALKLGAAGIAGAAGLGAASQTADAATGSAGAIGSSGSRPDLLADTVDANSIKSVGFADNVSKRVVESSGGSATHFTARQTTTNVSTSAKTIFALSDTGGSTARLTIIGRNDSGSDSFVSDIAYNVFGNASVVADNDTRGTPAGRTYSVSVDELQLTMGGGTYNVIAVGHVAEGLA